MATVFSAIHLAAVYLNLRNDRSLLVEWAVPGGLKVGMQHFQVIQSATADVRAGCEKKTADAVTHSEAGGLTGNGSESTQHADFWLRIDAW